MRSIGLALILFWFDTGAPVNLGTEACLCPGIGPGRISIKTSWSIPIASPGETRPVQVSCG